MGARSAEHELYAVKYAERSGTRGTVFAHGDPHDAPLAMDYFIWVATGPDGAIVIDTGFDRAEAEQRGRTFLRTPTEALALVGVEPADVHDVVITHMHYDHAGNLDAFPNATFHVQDVEMRYVTGRSMAHEALRHAFNVEDVVDMVRLIFGERVVFHDGDADLCAGISLHHIGGHTPGQMSVSVATRRGAVVVASDAAHYYESFEQNRVFLTHESVTEMLEGYRMLRRLADGPDHIVPGHDPLVLQHYPAPSPETAGAVAVLHQDPTPRSDT